MKLPLLSIAVGVIVIACSVGSDEMPEGEATAPPIENSTAISSFEPGQPTQAAVVSRVTPEVTANQIPREEIVQSAELPTTEATFRVRLPG